MLRAGRLDREVIVERNTPTRNVLGGNVDSWATLHTVWCEVIPIRGTELMKLGIEVSTEVAKFRTHYISGITTADRISYDSDYWDILYVSELGRGQGLEITAKRVGA